MSRTSSITHHEHDRRPPSEGGPHSATPFTSTTALAVPTGHLACERCASLVEQRLRQQPGVVSVHVDARTEIAHVEAHAGRVTVEELASLGRVR